MPGRAKAPQAYRKRMIVWNAGREDPAGSALDYAAGLAGAGSASFAGSLP